MSPYVRTVKSASGRDSDAGRILIPARVADIEHIGSAHDEAEVEVLKAAARQHLAAGQDELDPVLERAEPVRGAGRPAADHVVTDGYLWDVLVHGYDELGLDQAARAGSLKYTRVTRPGGVVVPAPAC